MIEERIEVIVGEDGSLTAETKGLKGATCEEELLALLEDVACVNTFDRTTEAYEQPPAARIAASARLAGRRG